MKSRANSRRGVFASSSARRGRSSSQQRRSSRLAHRRHHRAPRSGNARPDPQSADQRSAAAHEEPAGVGVLAGLGMDSAGPSADGSTAATRRTLSIRDSVKCRRLIESPWYQSSLGRPLRADQRPEHEEAASTTTAPVTGIVDVGGRRGDRRRRRPHRLRRSAQRAGS